MNILGDDSDNEYEEVRDGFSGHNGFIFDIKLEISYETNYQWTSDELAKIISMIITGQIIHKHREWKNVDHVIAGSIFDKLCPNIQIEKTSHNPNAATKWNGNISISGIYSHEDLVLNSGIVHDQLTEIVSMIPVNSGTKKVHNIHSDTVHYFIKYFLSPTSQCAVPIFSEKGFPLVYGYATIQKIMKTFQYEKNYNHAEIWQRVLNYKKS